MYLAGVSTRQVDDTGRLLWGERMPSQTLSDKPRRVYEDIDQWRNRPLAAHSYPYLFADGVRRQAHVGRVGRERERAGRDRRGRHHVFSQVGVSVFVRYFFRFEVVTECWTP